MASAPRRIILTAGLAGVGASLGLLSGCSEKTGEKEPVTIAVVMKGGKLSPSGERVSVSKGSEVTVTVTSDVALLVHVHGYDKELHAVPGKDATTTFTADLVGTFEVEAHDPARIIAQLMVK